MTSLRNTLRGTWVHHLYQTLYRLKRRALRRSDGEKILLQRYGRIYGRQPNLDNPKTFSEKLFRRMVMLNRTPTPTFTRLSDKLLVRDYVLSRVGPEYLVQLLWHGDDPREIPFGVLPQDYVIKTNHAYNQVVVVNGEVDRAEIINKFSAWLDINHYWSAREYQYYDIEPRVMIERYLQNDDGSGPLDYKFWCFHGSPEVVHVDDWARSINPFFDMHWNLLDLHYREAAIRQPVPKPTNFEEMKEVAAKLSSTLDFVRVDLYNVNGKVYFGEMSLTPTAGNYRFIPDCWDLTLGEKW